MAQSHPSSDHRQHAKFSTSFASSSSSPSPAAAAANAANASPSPSSSDVLPPHPPTITNSQAFDVGGASSPHHLHQFTNQCSTRPNADDTPHMPSLFYLHHQHHQHEQKLPISHHRESHIQTESAHRMNNNNETVSTSAASKGIEQALRSYVHSGISSPPSAPPRYHGSVLGVNITGGVREQPISFLQPQESSNRFYPANSTNTLKGGFPPTHRVAPHPLSNREEGPPNGISSRGPLNNGNDLFYTADSIQSSKGGLPLSDRPPYTLSNREEGSSTGIGISTPTNTDTDRNARLSAISHSHSRFKPNDSPSSHIDHHHPRVALDIMSDHRENTTSFLPSTHSIPEIDVAPSGNLPSSFPLNRVPSIPSSVNVESGHELFHGASKSGLLLHGSSSLAGFLSRTSNDGSSSGNSSDEGSYERQGRLPVAASAIHHQMKEPSTYFEGYTWDEAGNVMAGSANAAAPYNRKTFRDSDKYFTGPLLVDSQKGSTLGHSGLINHFTLGTTTSPESIYFTDRLSADSIPCRTRAKRGCATHPRSIAERVRRTKISERMKKLQELVPNMDKHTNTAEMLDEAVEYVKGLQHQVKELTEAQAKCSCSYSNTRKDQ